MAGLRRALAMTAGEGRGSNGEFEEFKELSSFGLLVSFFEDVVADSSSLRDLDSSHFVLSNNKNVSSSSGDILVSGVSDIDEIERTWMSGDVRNSSNSADIVSS